MIHQSTNDWYQKNLGRDCFPPDKPDSCLIFPEVYESLDPGCCLIAEIDKKIAGSCFYHPRETHVSLGIMNASSRFAGQGVARTLLNEVIARAGKKPIRLVSSALNLDSYSLYTRKGFKPTAIYQDMFFPELPEIKTSSCRPATLADLPAITELEERLTGLRRDKDYQHMLQNKAEIWQGSVSTSSNGSGEITGFLFSINHPGSAMLGPGIMNNDHDALSLIGSELKRFSSSPLFLAPANRPTLMAQLYQLGARNCELHLSQVLGNLPQAQGVVMPTFLPE